MAALRPSDQQVLETLKKAGTGMVVDALAISGIKGGIMGIRPARGSEDYRVAGPAVTVLFAPNRPDTPSLNNYQVIRQSTPGSILVIDGKGLDGHYTGDNQGLCAKKQGLSGVVVFGGARDIAGYRKIGMPLYCTSPATRDKPGEYRLTACNVPVEIGGVSIAPGDIMVCDEDGVVAVPVGFVEQVMKNLNIIQTVETDLSAAIETGAPLEDLRAIIARKQ